MVLECNIAEAEVFLYLLDPQAKAFTFRMLDDVRLPTGKPRDRADLRQTYHEALPAIRAHLERCNTTFGAAIYLTINRTDLKGHTQAHITFKRAFYTDLDKGLPKTWQLPPSIIVETSPGKYQAYWLIVDSISDAEFLGVLRHIAYTYGGDPGVISVERILRLPGFYHQKGKPHRVRIVEASGRRYTVAEVTAVHPPMIEQRKAEPLPAQIEETSRNRTLISAAGRMRRTGFPVDAIEAALQVLNAQQCIPPLEPKEVEKIARSSGRYTPGALVKDGEIKWPETRDDVPFPKSAANVAAYLQHLGAIVWKNEFDGRYNVDGFDAFEELDDEARRRLRILAESYSFRVPKEAFEEYLFDLAAQDSRHPVREYLMGLRWDGVPRLRRWLITYTGAHSDPEEYLEAVSEIVLIAAVQRVRVPGCKFDYMTVLEGPQDIGKSSVWRILAGDHWFTDCLLIGADSKVVIEQTRGKWIIEHAELDGMGQRDVERIKTFISRQEDTARLAYGRSSATVPRQCIFVGTTNNAAFLRDETGNRRFLPVRCGKIDLAGLYRDRDQLWAEAVHTANERIKAGTMRLDLPAHIKPLAVAAQATRQIISSTEDKLTTLLGQIKHGFVATECIYSALAMVRDEERNRATLRISRAMYKMGWQSHKRRDNGKNRNGYWIGAPGAMLYVWNPATGEFVPDPEHSAAQYFR